MPRHKHFLLPLVLITVIVISACGDLAGNPEIVQPISTAGSSAAVPEVPDALPLELPPNTPDIANGQRIYAQNCTSCHGAEGAGNGELVASGQIPRMPSFLDTLHMREQSVEYYYDIITNGNLANLMPPWSGSLSVQERWDVLMYVYTLNYTEEQVALGESLLETSSDSIQLESDADLAQALTLTGDEAFAAVAYDRVQSVTNWDNPDAPAPTPQPELDAEFVNFSGTISNGSPDAQLPPQSLITVELQYGNFVDTVETLTTTMSIDGAFRFDNVPVVPNSIYFVVAFYDERPFVSERLTTDDLQLENTADITLYETITTPNIVTMTNLDLVIDNVTVETLGNGLVIGQTNTYDNPTDYVYHLAPPGQDVRISLLVSIPVGGVLLGDDQQQTLIPVQDQFSVIDTRPVYPGTHTVSTSYFLPYSGDAQTIDIVMNNQFEGEMQILVAEQNLQIVSDTLTFIEEVNMGTDDAPEMADLYRGTFSTGARQSVIFTIEGEVPTQAGEEVVAFTGDELVFVLIGVGVITVLVIGGLVLFLRGRSSNSNIEVNRLISEINRTKSLYEAGRISEEEFNTKTADLKNRLDALIDGETA